MNNIPAQLVERVDIDTGGASAVYGSDAVSGVVNFILKKNFTGVQIDAQYSFYQHDNDDSGVQSIVKAHNFPTPSGSITDGYTTDVEAIMGVNSPDGKGNLTAYADYRSIRAIIQSDRDFSACTLTETGSTFACGGSSTTSPPRLTLYNAAGTTAGKSYTISGNGAATTLVPYTAAANAFNYGPYNYFQRPDTRYNLGAMGHYEISPMADVYTQLMFMDDDSTAQIAPGGIFYGAPYTIPCSNPFFTAAELATFCNGSKAGNTEVAIGKRNVEGGGRQSEFRHTSYRLLTGVKGDLDKAWSYDGYVQYGSTIYQASAENYFSASRISNAVSGCVINPNDGCVPYDPFQGGGVTKAMLNYLQVPGFTKGSTTEQVANLTFTGKLGEYGIKSPFAEDGVGVALGTEYRRESIIFASDAETSAGDLSGSGGASPPINGAFDVYDLFAELNAPLVQNMPFAKAIDLHLAYRYSDYSTAGATDTYGAELSWKPISDLTLRGSFERAVRAPNILELFSPQNVVLGLSSDPCSGPAVGGFVNGTSTGPTAATTTKFTQAQCALAGVSAAQFGNVTANTAGQYNVLSGGNPNLQPEVADTYSGGIVYRPAFLPGFDMTIDYFNIFVAGVISGAATPSTVIPTCAATGNSYYCSLIHRDSLGSLWLTPQGYVTDTSVNAGSLGTSGVDLQANYRLPLSRFGLDHWGSISFNFIGTYLLSYENEPVPGQGKYDCKGLYGETCGTPNPIWRSSVRATWNTPWHGLELSTKWRYYGAVRNDAASANPFLNSDDSFAADAKLPAQNYIDLAASIKIKDGYTLRAGVNNVFDKNPPLVGSTIGGAGGLFNGNTVGVYDALGRYIFVGITAAY